MPRVPTLVTVVSLLAVAPLSAQDSTSLSDVVPESPAFTFLGVNPSKINHPYTARDLGAAVLSGVDSTGAVRQGFALGITPWYLLKLKITPQDYAGNRLKYMLSWTQLSVGTTRASGDSGSTDLAIGLRTTIFDGGDPFSSRAFQNAYRDMQAACRGKFRAPPLSVSALRDSLQACFRRGNDSVRKKWLDDHKTRLSASIGVAPGWRFKDSKLGDSQFLGWSFWGAFGVRPGESFRLIGQVQYDYRAAIDSLPSSEILSFGGRAAVGSDNLDAFAEVLSNRRFNAPAGTDPNKGSWSWGVEARIAANTWLSTGFGSTFANQDGPDHVVVLANIRWGISSKARLSSFSQ